jgi:hypothetical protein
MTYSKEMKHDYEHVVGFLEELASLMDKWEIDAIVAKDEYPGYPECGQDICIRIEDPYCHTFDPDFGGYMHADSIRKELADHAKEIK